MNTPLNLQGLVQSCDPQASALARELLRINAVTTNMARAVADYGRRTDAWLRDFETDLAERMCEPEADVERLRELRDRMRAHGTEVATFVAELTRLADSAQNGAGRASAERTPFGTATMQSDGQETARVAWWSGPKPADGS